MVVVGNMQQTQSVRRRCVSRYRSIVSQQNPFHPFGGLFSSSDFDDGSYNISNHII